MALGFIKAFLLDECPSDITMPCHHCPLPEDEESLPPHVPLSDPSPASTGFQPVQNTFGLGMF